MERLYERTIELLGQGNEDPSFSRYIQDLGEEPQIYLENEKATEYAFNRSGLFLSSYGYPKRFSHIFFKSAQTNTGGYVGGFPEGINFGDTQEVISKKLNFVVFSSIRASGEAGIEYMSSEVLLTFYFEESSGKLWRVLARFIPAWDLFKNRPKLHHT